MTTKRKNKDVKLEKARLLEKAYKLASIGHWELDLGNEELYWSAEVKKLHEVDPDYQADVQTAIDFYPEGEYRMAIRNAVQEAIEHGKAYDLELKIITAKGNEKWIRTTGDSITENEICIKLYGSTQDISKRKKAEHSLQLQSIITDNLAEGVYLIRSSDGVIVYTNPTFDRMFGYEPGELVGKHVSAVNASTDKSPEEIAEEINQSLREKGTWSGEVYNLKKNGTQFWCWANVSTFNHPQYGEVWVSVHDDIDEKKKAEDALQKSEQRFRVAQEHSPDGFTILHPVRNEQNKTVDFTWIYQNEAIAQINGTDGQNIIGKRVLDVFPEHKGTNIFNTYIEVANTGDSKIMEDINVSEVISKPVWLRLTITSMGEDIAIVAQNVTEQKKAEKALIEHGKKLNAMFSASPVAIFEISPDGFVQSWNKASERIFGWTEKELLGKKLPIVPQHKQNEFGELREQVLNKEAFTDLELERLKKDGSIVHISLSTAPITDENDNVVSILAIASDITGRKIKDDQILLHSTALNSVANAVIITDRDGNIEWVNDAWSELTGYQEEEVLGGNPRILKSGAQDEAYYEELWDTILSGEVWSGELINKKKDGSLYHEMQTITPLMDADGEVTHLIGIKQDITQQKQIEEELRELVREKDVLLSEFHHRVKNNMAMLSAIMYLELIQTENEDVIENIQKNIHRINTIASVHELVYASKKWSKVNLNNIALKLVEPAQQDGESDCNVRVSVDSGAAFINVNQALPASLIINEMFRGMYKAACREEGMSMLNIEVLESGGKIQISISKIGTNGQLGIPEMIGVPGMQLIDTLMQQLNGSKEYNTTADKRDVQLVFDREDSVSGTSSAFLV